MIEIRKIQKEDHKSVVDLLQQLSVFEPHFRDMPIIWDRFEEQDHISAFVGCDSKNNVIAFGSICIEMKIRGGLMGHIEDVVVDEKFRGQGVGAMMMKTLIKEAIIKKCYKVSLECRDEKVGFYNALGFENTGHTMTIFIGAHHD